MLRKMEGPFDLLIHLGEGILASLTDLQNILELLEKGSGMISLPKMTVFVYFPIYRLIINYN